MRLASALLLLGCGAPAFVPVSFTQGGQLGFEVYAMATKKLNPSCESNCEFGKAIEDGGCSEIRGSGSTAVCTPSTAGGLFLPFQGVAPVDGGLTSPVRMIAPGSTLTVFDRYECERVFDVSGPMVVSFIHTMSECTIIASQ